MSRIIVAIAHILLLLLAVVGFALLIGFINGSSYKNRFSECESRGWTVNSVNSSRTPPCVDDQGNGKWL